MTQIALSKAVLKRFTATLNILQLDATVDLAKLSEQFNNLEATFGALEQAKLSINEFIELYPGLKQLEKVDIKHIKSTVRIIGIHVKAYKAEIIKRQKIDAVASTGI